MLPSLDAAGPCCTDHRHRVRVVKELVLKANGLCPRELKSRRCRSAFDPELLSTALQLLESGCRWSCFACKGEAPPSQIENRCTNRELNPAPGEFQQNSKMIFFFFGQVETRKCWNSCSGIGDESLNTVELADVCVCNAPARTTTYQ